MDSCSPSWETLLQKVLRVWTQAWINDGLYNNSSNIKQNEANNVLTTQCYCFFDHSIFGPFKVTGLQDFRLSFNISTIPAHQVSLNSIYPHVLYHAVDAALGHCFSNCFKSRTPRIDMYLAVDPHPDEFMPGTPREDFIF